MNKLYLITSILFVQLCLCANLYPQEKAQLWLKGAIETSGISSDKITLRIEDLSPNGQVYLIQTSKDSYQLPISYPNSTFITLLFSIPNEPQIEPMSYTVEVTKGVDTVECNISMLEKQIELEAVEVNEQQNRLLTSRFLRDTEQTMILVGKKSTVAIIDNMMINKVANNARQMFRNVSGIVIHEGGEGGLQLNIGARGLNPNRSANFSVRQNGYDISADPLGYPESYYTPNADDIQEIQVIRGASALQYGSQFGGMVNFKLAAPSSRKVELKQHLSAGSYGFVGSYTRLSGTVGKIGYYASATLKRADGYRKNSDLKSYSVMAQLHYALSDYQTLSLENTKYHYLEHQPGGLTDVMFRENPRQSNRDRNWFLIDWNIATLRYTQRLPQQRAELTGYLSGLYAKRYALGYRNNRVSIPDIASEPRDLQKGTFRNLSAEVRYLQRFYTPQSEAPSAWLLGAKYYQAANRGMQSLGSTGSDADFDPLPIPTSASNFPVDRVTDLRSSYRYPNVNFALFAETSLRLGDKWSLVPGVRIEQIRTAIHGQLTEYYLNAGSVDSDLLRDDLVNSRRVILYGLAAAYKMPKIELYGNLTKNYRAVTFTDMRAQTPGLAVNPRIKDEKGYSSDIGVRSRDLQHVEFDVSGFFLYYADRIGEYFRENPASPGTYHRYRDNIADAISYGVEAALNLNLEPITQKLNNDLRADVFTNIAITGSRYLKSSAGYNVKGNEVEFVPQYNIKAGANIQYQKASLSAQVMHVTYQYTDAVNEPQDIDDAIYGIFGAIPGYTIVDVNVGYQINKHFKAILALQNIGNTIYMTRRATGYPGPGIIPSAPFNVMGTLQMTF